MGPLMKYTPAYFLERGVEFRYETEPGVPSAYGRFDENNLRSQLNEAIEERRNLPRLSKRHDGPCNQDGRSIKGIFCTVCRRVRGVCIFCASTGNGGNLDCHLCRMANQRVLREQRTGEPF